MRPGSPCLESPLKWKKGGKRTQSPNPTKLTAMSWWGPLPSGISYWGEGAISSYFLTEGHISLQSYSKWISWAHFWKWLILYLNCHLKCWQWQCHKYNTFVFSYLGAQFSALPPPCPKQAHSQGGARGANHPWSQSVQNSPPFWTCFAKNIPLTPKMCTKKSTFSQKACIKVHYLKK